MKTAQGFGLALIAFPLSLQATLFEFNGINQLIPDGDPSGIVSRQTLQLGPTDFVVDVNVRLEIAGVNGEGFTGDLYVWLQHGNALSVLLNRPGRDTGRPEGHANNSLWLLLDDEALLDIHTTEHIEETTRYAAQPDGRQEDPAAVITSSDRGLKLNTFQGLDPNGEWNLFVSDLSGGGQMRLESWGLEITTGDLLPEGGVSLLGAIAALVAWSHWSRTALHRSRLD
jgi:subtilisin-like proprotein convertase family protein